MFDELIMPLRATSVAFTPVVQSADDAFIASALQHASADLLTREPWKRCVWFRRVKGFV